MKLNVIILSGGKQSRFPEKVPKCLADVGGAKCIDFILQKLSTDNRVVDITVVCNPDNHDDIMMYLLDNWSEKFFFDYVVQDQPNGTAHAVSLCIQQHIDDYVYMKETPLLIINGDTIVYYNKDILKTNVCWGAITHRSPSCSGHGVTCKNGFLTSIVEGENTEFTDAGMYMIDSPNKLYKAINTVIESNITENGEYQLVDAIQTMINSGNLFRFVYVYKVYDVGTPEGLRIAREECTFYRRR